MHVKSCYLIKLLFIHMQVESSSSLDIDPKFILQESYTDEIDSVVAYTILDVNGVRVALYDTDPSINPILPLAFVMVQMKQTNSINTAQVFSTRNIQQDMGCLLTVGRQYHASTDPYAQIHQL